MDRRTKLAPELDSGQDEGERNKTFPETVCHRIITGDPAYYPQAAFHGRTIYFCTETCQSVFLSDPERFYAAHSRRSKSQDPCEFLVEKDK
jgi:YHS domain-containing protein